MHKPDVSPHVDWSLVWSVCMVSDEDQKTASYVLFGFRPVSGDEYYDGAFLIDLHFAPALKLLWLQLKILLYHQSYG